MVVDAALNAGPAAFFDVVANSAGAAAGASGTHPVGQRLAIQRRNGNAFVAIRDLPPSEVLVTSVPSMKDAPATA